MITHRFLLKLAYLLLVKGGEGYAVDEIGKMLPLLLAADERGPKPFTEWTTRWWVGRIARCTYAPTFEDLVARNPELLDSALGARENYK